MKYDYLFKIILAGDTGTGKTYFFNLLTDKNNTYEQATIGVDFATLYKYIYDKLIRVNLWDTAGQERFHSVIQNYFREITGYILFFDLNNIETFYSLKRWMKNIQNKNICDHEHPMILIGNKNDLHHNVNQYDIIEFIEKYNLIYIETSLNNNKINTNDIIELLLDKIYKQFIIHNIENENENIILCNTIKKYKDNNNKIHLISKNNKNNNNNKNCC